MDLGVADLLRSSRGSGGAPGAATLPHGAEAAAGSPADAVLRSVKRL